MTQAIQGLQVQMTALTTGQNDIAARLTAVETRSSFAPALPSSTVPLFTLGLPGYGGIPAPPGSRPVITEISSGPSEPPTTGVPITQIAFPSSPSPQPSISSILQGASIHPHPSTLPSASMHSPSPRTHIPPDPEGHAIPKYHKLTFPTYDGSEDPLGWLNKCEQFFRAQQTRSVDRVWLASYHLHGTAQQWYHILERDAGEPHWEEFTRLCHNRFGPAISTNHLADLARLPFHSLDAYMQAFQARLAHAGRLAPLQ